MRARLFARYGVDAGLEVEFAGEATIGRGEDNLVPLDSREVSQRHARVFFDADSASYWVEDLDSLNGTLLDGEPLTGRERLADLHVLTLGGATDLFFLAIDRGPGESETAGTERAAGEARTDPETPAPTPERERTRVDAEVPTLPPGLQAGAPEEASGDRDGSATSVERMPVDLPPILAGGGEGPRTTAAAGPALEVLDDPGGRFELVEGENLVGRSGRARIVLSHPELSRRHATLRVAGGRVWLRDEGSRNHTYVDDEEIAGEVEVQPGAELRFGSVRARLVAAGGGGEG